MLLTSSEEGARDLARELAGAANDGTMDALVSVATGGLITTRAEGTGIATTYGQLSARSTVVSATSRPGPVSSTGAGHGLG